VVFKTIWLPGILLFCLIALPWYFAVQARNPQFFREFIVEHNLGRFSKKYLSPHRAALVLPPRDCIGFYSLDNVRDRSFSPVGPDVVDWTKFDRPVERHAGISIWHFSSVAGSSCRWFFFSISQSKLPGYILPAIPAGALLLADYLRRRLAQNDAETPPLWLAILHALFAAAPIVPALLIAYLITQHRLPGGQPMLVALAVAFVLSVGIALTLIRKNGLRMLGSSL